MRAVIQFSNIHWNGNRNKWKLNYLFLLLFLCCIFWRAKISSIDDQFMRAWKYTKWKTRAKEEIHLVFEYSHSQPLEKYNVYLRQITKRFNLQNTQFSFKFIRINFCLFFLALCFLLETFFYFILCLRVLSHTSFSLFYLLPLHFNSNWNSFFRCCFEFFRLRFYLFFRGSFFCSSMQAFFYSAFISLNTE